MSQQDNLTIVKDIYDAVGRGDVAAILDRVSDDVDWAAEAASKTAPWYGPRAGKDGVASFFSDLATSIEISAFTPHSFAAGEDDVHLLVDWTIRSVKTGRHAARALHWSSACRSPLSSAASRALSAKAPKPTLEEHVAARRKAAETPEGAAA